jgi:hypothetical protein
MENRLEKAELQIEALTNKLIDCLNNTHDTSFIEGMDITLD